MKTRVKTCDHCGTPAKRRYAVRLKGRVAMVGSSCAKRFPRARTSDLIRVNDRAVLAHGYAPPPQPISETEFYRIFPRATRLHHIAYYGKWKGYGVAWSGGSKSKGWGKLAGPVVSFYDPYQERWLETIFIDPDTLSPLPKDQWSDPIPYKLATEWLDTFRTWQPPPDEAKTRNSKDRSEMPLRFEHRLQYTFMGWINVVGGILIRKSGWTQKQADFLRTAGCRGVLRELWPGKNRDADYMSSEEYFESSESAANRIALFGIKCRGTRGFPNKARNQPAPSRRMGGGHTFSRATSRSAKSRHFLFYVTQYGYYWSMPEPVFRRILELGASHDGYNIDDIKVNGMRAKSLSQKPSMLTVMKPWMEGNCPMYEVLDWNKSEFRGALDELNRGKIPSNSHWVWGA